MTGAFFLGICISYPNGLFHFSRHQIGPSAEYFLVCIRVFCEGTHSYYPVFLWYILELYSNCVLVDVQDLVISITVWT